VSSNPSASIELSHVHRRAISRVRKTTEFTPSWRRSCDSRRSATRNPGQNKRGTAVPRLFLHHMHSTSFQHAQTRYLQASTERAAHRILRSLSPTESKTGNTAIMTHLANFRCARSLTTWRSGVYQNVSNTCESFVGFCILPDPRVACMQASRQRSCGTNQLPY
jgi:hypothetical protein